MNKNILIALVAVVVIGGVGYSQRHLIKQMFTHQSAIVGGGTVTSAPADVFRMRDSVTLGKYMTDPRGMTLYTFDKDAPGVSNCKGACLANWPIYAQRNPETNLPEGISTIKRPDGPTQYTWNKMPLYYYIKDTAAGDVKGNGVGGVWHIVK